MGHRNKPRHPKISETPKVPSEPKAQSVPAKSYRVPAGASAYVSDYMERCIVFRFDCVDLEDDCPWSVARMSNEEHELLLRKLRDFETAKLKDILETSYTAFTCYPDFTKCPNRVPQDRLARYYERQGDALARFRLGGTRRLYGFLVGNEFHILWWDPKHEVWPSAKKNT